MFWSERDAHWVSHTVLYSELQDRYLNNQKLELELLGAPMPQTKKEQYAWAKAVRGYVANVVLAATCSHPDQYCVAHMIGDTDDALFRPLSETEAKSKK